MSYLALARKWRPKTFAELVGQEHVVKALRHALDSGRVHHAFLFTGTRGVGKTTIARIFAKSLNCETGVSSDPCGQCPVCLDVDAGRFVDLIEIDAASRTKVDDTRELLENVVYAPSRGRYKVFLIDEVHMLSGHSFNALLKTLEEPPEHVKFLLATTDPQKLPVTVLSRCLQFNLRRLRREEIGEQMRHILAAEGIAAEPPALDLLTHAADGSLRDALSLLDQAIAHGGGGLVEGEVRAMLGTLDQDAVLGLLEALAGGDGPALYRGIETLAGYVVDYGAVLDAVAAALHRIQLRQLLPETAADETLDPARIAALADQIAPEDVQLYYQLATVGSRDLDLAPTPRIGFEMSLLRMLAFRPEPASAPTAAGGGAATATSAPVPAKAPASPAVAPANAARPGPAEPGRDKYREPPAASAVPTAVAEAPFAPAAPTPPPSTPIPPPRDANDWAELIARLGLAGPSRQVAEQCAVIAVEDGVLRLGIRAAHDTMLTPRIRAEIERAVCDSVDGAARVRFEVVADVGETPAHKAAQARQQRQTQAESGFAADARVRAAMAALDAEIAPGSVRPLSN